MNFLMMTLSILGIIVALIAVLGLVAFVVGFILHLAPWMEMPMMLLGVSAFLAFLMSGLEV